MTHSASNVLVLGDDMRIFLAVCRSLGRKGLCVHAGPLNMTAPALTSRYIAKVHALPTYEAGPEAWGQHVAALIAAEGISLVIPCSDPFIMMLHEQRGLLSQAAIAIPGPAAIEQLFDKDLTHQLCERLGIPASPAKRLTKHMTAEDLLTGFSLPFVLKPRRSYWLDQPGHWGRVYIVEDVRGLHAALEDITDTDRYMAEAFFEGTGCGISVIAKDGDILQAFQHRRLREGLGAASSYRVSERLSPGMLAACTSIMREMKHTGVCMFEFRVNDVSGKWILLETNARFWGSMPLPLALGVDFPAQLHELLAVGRRPVEVGYAVGVRSRNITLDGFNLLKMIPRLNGRTALPWLTGLADYAMQPLRWITGQEFNDSFSRDDLRPGFAEIASLFRGRK